jgi:hypothetical protein
MDGQEDATPGITVLAQTRSRIPLIPRRSSPSTPPNQIRRKESFVRRLDSSEESPSSHGSIFEALYQSATNSDDTGHFELGPRSLPTLTPSTSPPESRENDENIRQSPASTKAPGGSESQFLYGHGTILETIKERTSHGSIRILARRKSVDDLRSPSSSQPGGLASRKNPLRQKSHSLDDLEAAKESYQAKGLVESTAKQSPEIHEIYAGPKTPVQGPPKRPGTPPGMPSWTEHQLRFVQRPKRRASTSLRQFFGLQSSRASLQDGEQNRSIDGRAIRRASRPRMPRIARFRPPKSVYGRLDQHPFNDAPTAIVDPFLHLPVSSRSNRKRKSVRFTPSTAARDSGTASLQGEADLGAITDSQRAAQAEPSSPIPSTHSLHASPEKRRACPHRKSRFKHLEHSNSTIPGVDYQAILAHPLTRDISHASLPRLVPPSPTHLSPGSWSGRAESAWDMGVVETENLTLSGAVSNSSTTHLMSGALIAASPSPSPTPGSRPREDVTPQTEPSQCWRCKFESMGERVRERLGDLRKKSGRCLWFVCCGFDTDEEGSTYAPRNVRVELAGQPSVGASPSTSARDRWWGGTADSTGRPLGPVTRSTVFAYPQAWIM